MQILKYRASLLSARGNDGPNALAPASAFFSAGTLRDASVNHDEANGLLRHIVGRLDLGRGHKLEISLAMFGKAMGDVLAITCARNVGQRLPQHLPTRQLQAGLKNLGRPLLPLMNDG